MKKALILERSLVWITWYVLRTLFSSYLTATGGGIDKQSQSIIDKLKKPTETDELLIDYLKKSDALGVGPLTLQTGYVRIFLVALTLGSCL